MRPLLLDLFCGAGGAAKGYHDAGFEIVGIVNRPQPHYPYEFVLADAMTYPLDGFDVIHASPPCQAYSWVTPKRAKSHHLDLLGLTRNRLANYSYVIENVVGARNRMRDPVMLCGTMFGLKVIRHRLFECSWGIVWPPATCAHNGYVSHGDYAAVYGHNSRGPRIGKGQRLPKPTKEAPAWSKAMAIDWMTLKELTQAVPPAYSEYLGKQMLKAMEMT